MTYAPRASFSDPDLTGSVALVTGSGHGIGATIARRIAAAHGHVILMGRDEDKLTATASSIINADGSCTVITGDVASEKSVVSTFSRARAVAGRFTLLVNNAGVAGPATPLEHLSAESWDQVLAINLRGVFLCCREAIPLIRGAGGGSIVNIGSVTGKRPLANRTPYAASKLALIGLTRTLAHEVAADEITVNAISPYLVSGVRHEQVIAAMSARRGVLPDTLRSQMMAESPFRRPVSEDDVADLALFLASSAARNLTGQDFNVSAGAVMY